jgi:two-component system NtrC family response regulator
MPDSMDESTRTTDAAAPTGVKGTRVLIVGPTGIPATWREQLIDHGCEVQCRDELEGLVDEARPWAADVVLLASDFEPARLEASVEELRGVHDCSTLLLVDGYEPATFAHTMQLGIDTCVDVAASPQDVLRVIEQELRHRRAHQPPELRTRARTQFVGTSEQMKQVCRLVAKAAPSGASVLIGGESGTGKELVARAIHRLSPRRDHPFVALNCGAIPESLLESELFGHEAGAFTGATERRIGRFEQADGGVLFLDEIGELPRPMQVKLLRVLQERCFERVGGVETVSVDVRVLAASNRDLANQVDVGEFRSDLFYRLNVLQIELPALRDRAGDLPGLWQHFVARAARAEALQVPKTSAEVLRMLYRYDWPGNVRELQNVARHSVTMSSGRQVTPGRLPLHFMRQITEPAVDADQLRLPGMSLEEVERVAILQTHRAVPSVKEAAELLGISQRTMYYRLKKYRDEGYLEAESPAGDKNSNSETGSPPDAHQDALPRLILADDDEHIRWALKRHLENEYTIVAVSNGRALVNETRVRAPDVILSDIRMPGLDGIQVLRELYMEEWDVPIVLISAYGDRATRAQAELLGAVAVLDKPIDMTELRAELKAAVNGD